MESVTKKMESLSECMYYFLLSVRLSVYLTVHQLLVIHGGEMECMFLLPRLYLLQRINIVKATSNAQKIYKQTRNKTCLSSYRRQIQTKTKDASAKLIFLVPSGSATVLLKYGLESPRQLAFLFAVS